MADVMRATIITRAKQSWLSGLLVSGIVIGLWNSTANAVWLRDPEPLTSLIVLGVVFGALLAESRFRTRTILAINLVISVSTALLLIGRVMPSVGYLTTAPLAHSLWLMNVRLMALLDQVQRDLASIITGRFPGAQLIIVVFGLFVWNVGVWLMWSIARRRSAFLGIAPGAIAIMLNTALDGHAPALPLIFIVCSVLLIARTAYTSQLHHWQQHHIGYPELISEDWALGAALVSIVVVFIAGLSTPEWRASIDRFIQSLRPPPPQVAAPIAPVVPLPSPETSFATSFVPDLQTVGDPLPQSDETIFTVTTDEPPGGVDRTGLALPPKRQHYWRGAIFDRYTGSGWEPIVAGDQVRQVESPENVPPGRYALKQHFEIVSLRDNRLFAANDPVAGSEGTTVQIANTDRTAAVLRGTTPKYEVLSWAAQVDESQLTADSTHYPAAIRDRYLQVPDELPPRVRDLAARIAFGARSPYDKAVRIQEYLRQTYPYRLDVPRPPQGRDVVDYFLFDVPGGFCSYYASAMAVMLRTQGVPARVVTGFATGDYDGLDRKYRVTVDAAHAWVEVYFPSYGWIEFEPTASRSVFDYQAEAKQPDRSPTALTVETRTSIEQALGLGLMLAIALAAIGGAAVYTRRQIYERRLAPDRLARDLYWQVRRSLAHGGVIASRSITPDEFLAIHRSHWEQWPRLHEAMQSVATLYIRAVYTPNVPSRKEVEASRRLWRLAWRDRWRLWWHAMKTWQVFTRRQA